jgi:hypothetical protein
MKRIIYFIIGLMLLSMIFGYGQDSTVSLSWQSFYSTTMTGTKDTIDFTWGSDRYQYNYFMISAVSSAVDTLTIYTLGEDGFTWTLTGVEGLTTGTTAAFINATTTGSKYFIIDPVPKKIRVIDSSDDGSTCAISISAVYARE